jgi:hypothetical protein
MGGLEWLRMAVRSRQDGVSTKRMPLESFTTLALPRDLGTPAQGRRLLESALDSLPESVLADAQLLLTEVLSNAILHGSAGPGARLDVLVEADESIVRVTVTDRSPQFPRPAIHPPDPSGCVGVGALSARAPREAVGRRRRSRRRLGGVVRAQCRPITSDAALLAANLASRIGRPLQGLAATVDRTIAMDSAFAGAVLIARALATTPPRA